MKRRAIAPPSIFNSDPYGFSQGILAEGGKRILFISGQLAADKEGNFVGGTFREQCQMALDGIAAVLNESGMANQNVMKITAYVTDMKGTIEEFTELTKQFFSDGFPASTLVETKGLAFPGQVVEIEAVALG
ncbi:MAG: RidA family protein [Thaumarchaeota archaeon]|nr:RidA family protein [Nitrososphaerota archaeon]